jgi:hypothetical protein
MSNPLPFGWHEMANGFRPLAFVTGLLTCTSHPDEVWEIWIGIDTTACEQDATDAWSAATPAAC